MGFTLKDDLGPVVLGEWQDLDERCLVVFLHGRLDVRWHLGRVNGKEETTIVKDLERIGRNIGGRGSSELFGEVDDEFGRGASTLLWVFEEGGYS